MPEAMKDLLSFLDLEGSLVQRRHRVSIRE